MKKPNIYELFPGIINPMFRRDYEAHEEQVIVFRSYIDAPNDRDEDEYDEEEDEEVPDYECGDLENISLQKILDLLPPDIKPSDIKVSVKFDCSAFAMEGVDIKFFYMKHVEARPELYEKHKKEWEQGMLVLERKEKEYETWKKEQEIKDLEKKLKDLKK